MPGQTSTVQLVVHLFQQSRETCRRLCIFVFQSSPEHVAMQCGTFGQANPRATPSASAEGGRGCACPPWPPSADGLLLASCDLLSGALADDQVNTLGGAAGQLRLDALQIEVTQNQQLLEHLHIPHMKTHGFCHVADWRASGAEASSAARTDTYKGGCRQVAPPRRCTCVPDNSKQYAIDIARMAR